MGARPKDGLCFDLLAIATSDATATTSESERSERHSALEHIHTWAVDQGQMEIQKFDDIKQQYELLCARGCVRQARAPDTKKAGRMPRARSW